MMVEHRSRILSGAPFMTRRWTLSPSGYSWIETWYLLVELKGISHTFLCLALYPITSPVDNSVHLRMAASEASPLTSRLRTGLDPSPGLNSARLHNAAHLSRGPH